jgi:transposase-like protein
MLEVTKGRPKGGNNKYWSKEAKLKIVRRVTENFESTFQVSKSEKINNGMLNNWLKAYYNQGEIGLENKRKPGNPLSKYQNSKNLNYEQQLEYENMKLRIEVERLKKGYLVKEDGQKKEFISINNKNLK